MMDAGGSAMEITSTAMEAQSVLEPDSSPVESDLPTTEPDEAALDDPADDSDLRTLDVTAGEPD
jgi:hypothetical protein